MLRKLLVGLSLVAVLSFVVVGSRPSTPSLSLVELNSPVVPVAHPAVLTVGNKHVLTLAIPESRIVPIYGEIYEATEHVAEDILRLSLTGEPVYVVLDSPGGSVLSGAVIVSAMESASARAPIITICRGMCASMAAVIFSYGTQRYAFDRAIIMFHPASGGASGEVDKMTSQLNMIQRYVNKMEAYVANRAGITFSEFKALASAELWLDGEDAVSRKFADRLVSANIARPKPVSLFTFPPPDSRKAGTNKSNKLDLTWRLHDRNN